MFKYAFIVNSEKLTPETFSANYKNDDFLFYIAATHDIEMTKDLAKYLATQDVELIDLCGDFDAAQANKISGVSGLEVCYAKYTPEETVKMGELTEMGEYGIIVMGEGISEGVIEKVDVESDEFNTRVRLVGTDADARQAARELVAEGINFIELCSYFDVKKTNEIIDAIEGKVPVGYCG